jgi:hypothetical protein
LFVYLQGGEEEKMFAKLNPTLWTVALIRLALTTFLHLLTTFVGRRDIILVLSTADKLWLWQLHAIQTALVTKHLQLPRACTDPRRPSLFSNFTRSRWADGAATGAPLIGPIPLKTGPHRRYQPTNPRSVTSHKS